MNEQKRNYATLSLASAMFIFGTIGIFRKYIPLSSSLLATARGFIGMLFLLLVLFLKGQKPDWKSIQKNLLFLVLSGAFIGINWILLFESYQYTTVAVATLCYYMAPIIVIIASPLVLKEKLTLKKGICVAVALFGMVLVSGVLGTGISGTKGILLGLGAACFYATVILLNKFIHEITAYDKTIVQLFMAAAVLVPYIAVKEDLSQVELTPLVIVMVLIVGIVHTGIAYALYFGSMEHLKAQTIAIFSYIDPIVAILLSAFFLQEPMGILEIIGAVLVLCATFVSEL